MNIAKAANFIRKKIFEGRGNQFQGEFPAGCEEDAVPRVLVALVSMLLEGPNIQNQSCKSAARTKIAVSLAELLQFNAAKAPVASESSIRHVQCRETPLQIYTAFKLHSHTRNKGIIDTFHRHGLCISYDRFLSLSASMSNSTILRYKEENVICPANLKKSLFTVTAVGNIYFKTTSRTTKGEFHGTDCSVMQIPDEEKDGINRDTLVIRDDVPKQRHLLPLPSSYGEVQPLLLKVQELFVPTVGNLNEINSLVLQTNLLDSSRDKEYDWLKHAVSKMQKEELSEKEWISWSAYAMKQPPKTQKISIIALLPLFNELAHTLAMISHIIYFIKKITEYLNPGQTPVTVDQPLYALSKKIQWEIGGELAEDNFFVMLAPFHTEDKSLKLPRELLSGSGLA